MVDAFFLKLQRDNRQNPLAVDPAKGKIGKRLYFHSTVEMKQPHTLTEPQKIIKKANISRPGGERDAFHHPQKSGDGWLGRAESLGEEGASGEKETAVPQEAVDGLFLEIPKE